MTQIAGKRYKRRSSRSTSTRRRTRSSRYSSSRRKSSSSRRSSGSSHLHRALIAHHLFNKGEDGLHPLAALHLMGHGF